MHDTCTSRSLQSGRVVADAGNSGELLYGPFSFSAAGAVGSFIHWLNQKSHPYGRILSKWSPGSREFSAAWLYLGTHDPQGFFELQEMFYVAS